MKNVINLAGQISDAKMLADLDAEIASTERAAHPPEGSQALLGIISPNLAGIMPVATKQASKRLFLLKQVRSRLAELTEKERKHE